MGEMSEEVINGKSINAVTLYLRFVADKPGAERRLNAYAKLLF